MKYTVELTDTQMQVLYTALIEQPYRMVAPLITEIATQVSEQAKEQNESQAKVPSKKDG